MTPARLLKVNTMHPHHKLTLDSARSKFRAARLHMNREVKAVNIQREFIVVREFDDHASVCLLRVQILRALKAIEAYQIAGEILGCVEYALRKA